MSCKWLSMAVPVALAATLLGVSSCGDPQELVSIAIQPTTEAIGAATTPLSLDAGAQVQLTAMGSYIHPPVTKDITSQVTWTSDTPQMFTVSSAGLITATGLACGSTLISATVTTNHDSSGVSSSGAIVTGSMTASVICPSGTAASGPTVTVDFAGGGQGTVTSSPAGINCASTTPPCIGTFSSGATVTLTATALGSFGGWSGGCTSITGDTCTIAALTAPVSATATFN